MCGIVGIINFSKKPVLDKELKLMMQTIKHRGPDDEGIFTDNNVGLGFVRLSILDLTSAGHQPMFSHDNRFVMVFNGEIYNYIEIRNELKNEFQFKTGTDTEVILAAYQKWGKDCLNKFNGMFAFVIYDTHSKEIFGARDRYGIKPFYYFIDKQRFIFASEIKAILPFIEKKQNDIIIFDYLLYNRTDHTEKTFFQNILKLQHGHYLTLKNNKLIINQWYNLKQQLNEEKTVSPSDYRELFKKSLKLRLRADVPIGVTLSGGIDSSSIVSSLVKDFGLYELNTFSAVYGEDEPTDESKYIKALEGVVRNMHFIFPMVKSFYNEFEQFIEAHNEPVPDIGPYAQYKVMQLASEFVTVTLDGQGADEQLAGYHYFFGSYYLELLKKLKLIRLLYENFNYILKHKSLNAIKYNIYYALPFSIQTKANSNIFPSINMEFINDIKINSKINEFLYAPKDLNDHLYRHFEYKLEHLLRWEDLNAMHFSIESRVPFLDHNLVEATLKTPSFQKINKGETKHLLRQAVKDILPSEIYNRKDKKGFSNPREKWFRTQKFKNYIFELLNSKSFRDRRYFNPEIALEQYKKHLTGKYDFSKEIWKWINLEVWFRKFID